MPRAVRSGAALIRLLYPNAERIGAVAVFALVKRELEALVVRARGPAEFEYRGMRGRGGSIRKGVTAVNVVICFGQWVAVFP